MVDSDGTIKVLVIDDEQVVLDSITQKLMTRVDYRFSIQTTKSTDHLIETISSTKPDVILLDNWIGTINEGLQSALPTIRGAFPSQKVIIITSRRGGDTEQILEGRGWGAFAFIDKDGMWNDDLLVRRIVEAVGLKWQSR